MSLLKSLLIANSCHLTADGLAWLGKSTKQLPIAVMPVRGGRMFLVSIIEFNHLEEDWPPDLPDSLLDLLDYCFIQGAQYVLISEDGIKFGELEDYS